MVWQGEDGAAFEHLGFGFVLEGGEGFFFAFADHVLDLLHARLLVAAGAHAEGFSGEFGGGGGDGEGRAAGEGDGVEAQVGVLEGSEVALCHDGGTLKLGDGVEVGDVSVNGSTGGEDKAFAEIDGGGEVRADRFAGVREAEILIERDAKGGVRGNGDLLGAKRGRQHKGGSK